MLGLGVYWINEAYVDWQNRPVLTSITTTAYSVKQVDFPAVTICSPGLSEDGLMAGFLHLFFEFLLLRNISINVAPIKAAEILFQIDWTKEEIVIRDRVTTNLNSPLFQVFVNQSFPGLSKEDDLLGLVKLLTSKNPDSDIAANVALDGGYDPCNTTNLYGSSTAANTTTTTNTSIDPCDYGFALDKMSSYCYAAFQHGYYVDKDYADRFCNSYEAELLTFENDLQVRGLISLLETGKIQLPYWTGNLTFISATRNSNGNFTFGNIDIFTSFGSLRQSVNFSSTNQTNQTLYCMTAQYKYKYTYLELSPKDCRSGEFGTICRKYQRTIVKCSSNSTFARRDTLDLMLDSSLQADKNKAVAQKRTYFKDMFTRLNQTASFRALFSNLWYATLPCFDVDKITASQDLEKSVLKYCEWKGVQISCAAIFTTYPTDKGMCCAFNMKSADEIFQGKTYASIVTTQQKFDKLNGFSDSQVPAQYEKKNEPKTLPGRKKGLLLMLDAHSDLLAAGSVDSDYEGFTGLISASQSFPYTAQEGFEIKPGHNNIIALTGIEISADANLRDLSVESRNCLFPDESSVMRIHKNYTYSNCIFECALFYAQDSVAKRYNMSIPCMPWYFPSPEDSITICDPWVSVEFLEAMAGDIPDDKCSKCLPDCTTTIYEPMITTIPFRRCDESNLGVSTFCSLVNPKLPYPTKFSNQVIKEYKNRASPVPKFVEKMTPSTRSYGRALKKYTFEQMAREYDAYDKDIAVVEIYFKKSTVMQIGSEARSTWTDFMATVGGLLGLVLGMGFISFFEIIWLCLRLGARQFNFDWIIT